MVEGGGKREEQGLLRKIRSVLSTDVKERGITSFENFKEEERESEGAPAKRKAALTGPA